MDHHAVLKAGAVVIRCAAVQGHGRERDLFLRPPCGRFLLRPGGWGTVLLPAEEAKARRRADVCVHTALHSRGGTAAGRGRDTLDDRGPLGDSAE
ncbi:hypothetical protein DMH15_13325 [Streptomyces sp. WAC 06725]|nr:hypothetical protein DMH15_13325 [Streptomyces sp. WAC 06725]